MKRKPAEVDVLGEQQYEYYVPDYNSGISPEERNRGVAPSEDPADRRFVGPVGSSPTREWWFRRDKDGKIVMPRSIPGALVPKDLAEERAAAKSVKDEGDRIAFFENLDKLDFNPNLFPYTAEDYEIDFPRGPTTNMQRWGATTDLKDPSAPYTAGAFGFDTIGQQPEYEVEEGTYWPSSPEEASQTAFDNLRAALKSKASRLNIGLRGGGVVRDDAARAEAAKRAKEREALDIRYMNQNEGNEFMDRYNRQKYYKQGDSRPFIPAYE